MSKRIVSGIMFVVLLTGMLTLAFNVQPVKAEPKTWTADDDGPASFSKTPDAVTESDPADALQASINHSSVPTIKSFFEDESDRRSTDVFQLPLDSDGKSDLGKEVEWADFAYGDDDSTELVIGLSDTLPNSYSELVDLIRSYGGELVNTVSMGGEIAAVSADIPHGAMSTFASEVETTGLSRYIEPNVTFELDSVPNDPDWPKQWGPRVVEADYAWNTTMGDPSVLVAVIDTGIDWDHPDLAANYVPLGYDWVNDDTDPMDDRGHGTHCAGIIGAVINNSIGIAGLAQVRIMAEKGLSETGSGKSADLANGIVHAVDQGADIISCSWGGYFPSTLIYEAVKYAHDHGVLVIASAGNDATECIHYPSDCEEVVAVTATNKSDDLAYFTNFGERVEVAAPGVDIYSTLWNNAYASKSGTSMSAPHVAGVAALIWSQFPNMTRDQIRAHLRFTAEDLGDPGFDEYYGYGRINTKRAVEQLLPDHDLTLLYWKVPPILKPLDTVTINGTLLNFGTNNESDITVRLLVNDSIAESLFVSDLASGASTAISFVWSPVVEGKYNVTLYVEPVQSEMLTDNNILFRYAIVKLSKAIMIPKDFSTIQKAINGVSDGYIVTVESGTYHEHIIIAGKSVMLIGENPQTTVIDGSGVKTVVWVRSASNANVTGFTIQNGQLGIRISFGSSNTIISNTIANNYYGIWLYFASDNTVSENTVTNNYYGIWLARTINTAYHNNFIDNAKQVDSYTSTNHWDDGYPSGGNYWSDYAGNDWCSGPYQNEMGSDGIGDTPYVINADNKDNYPLMKPYPWDPHDIGVTRVESKSVIGQGFDLRVDVTIFNYGMFAETFNVSAFTNTTIIAVFTNITSPSRNSITMTFTWNITGVAKGSYTLTIYATQVSEETYTTDNTYKRLIIVTILGDVNGDRKVDGKDISVLDKYFGYRNGQPNYESDADINCDERIDGKDIAIAAKNFGETHNPLLFSS